MVGPRVRDAENGREAEAEAAALRERVAREAREGREEAEQAAAALREDAREGLERQRAELAQKLSSADETLRGAGDEAAGLRREAAEEAERIRTEAAERLLLDGALPHEVDAALTGFGFRMGPFAMADLAGLDIGFAKLTLLMFG